MKISDNSRKCPRCSGLIPGQIAVGGMSYLPPRWKTCPNCNGRGVINSMPPALLPEEQATGQLRYPRNMELVRPAIDCEREYVGDKLEQMLGRPAENDLFDVYAFDYHCVVFFVVKCINDALLFIEAGGEAVVPTDDMANTFREAVTA